jgi:hypothetical protein
MAKNTLALERLSSEEGKTNGQSRKISGSSVFWFPVYEGIFEHAPILKDAVWLFMWLIARTTRDSDGQEKVLGGIPIPDERPAAELNFPVKTVRRWRRMLHSSGYINLLRTPYGFRYTLLKSKKWQKPTPRELPKRAISESAQNGQRDLPLRVERVPATGRESARSGKYKEDSTGTTQQRNSGRDSSHDSPCKASPLKTLRTKPSGRGERQLGHAQTAAQIAEVMECWKGTISHELANSARSNYFQTSEKAQRRCGKEVDSYRRAFKVIEYLCDLSSTVLGREFCWNVRKVVEESQNETPRPKKWELCERILDECYETWSGVGTYSDVDPPYWPPDFNDHINRLFEREENVKIGTDDDER